jgi:pimeloyl-ACP methyl ester carboxylesterase
MLHYKKTGSGPVIVLIHGFLLSSEYWSDVQKDLEKNFTVISIDLIGFGKSPKPKSSHYTLGEQVRAIHTTLSKLEISSFILAGHSMGGVIAAQYAVAYPQQVKKLLLYMPPFFLSSSQAYRSISQTNTLYRIGLYSNYGRLLWAPVKVLTRVSPYITKPPYAYIAKALQGSTHKSRTLSQRNIIEGEPLLPILQRLKVPTTLYVGKKDRLIYQDNIAITVDKLHHISIQYLDTGHHFIVKNPTHLRSTLV